MYKDIVWATKKGNPFLCISCADQIGFAANFPQEEDIPLLLWNSGLASLNEEGKELLEIITPLLPTSRLNPEGDKIKSSTKDFPSFLNVLSTTLQEEWKEAIVLIYNGHYLLEGPQKVDISSKILALRQDLKALGVSLLFLGPFLIPPSELKNEFLSYNVEAPGDEELQETITSLYSSYLPVAKEKYNVELPPTLETSQVERIITSLRGQTLFKAETLMALSLCREGVDEEVLWNQRAIAVSTTPGLTLIKPRWGLESIGGSQGLKKHLDLYFNGENPPAVVVWLDEIGDAFSGVDEGDSGVRKYVRSQFLINMEIHGDTGLILMGIPGGGKSATAEGIALSYNVPLLRGDVGSLYGRYMGESESNSREFWRTLLGMAGGKSIFFVGTTNSTASIKSQLKRRFSLGMFYTGIPTLEEQEEIAAIHLTKYKLEEEKFPLEQGLVGSEVKEICRKAKEYKTSLKEARVTLNPYYKAYSRELQAYENEAHGVYISTRTGLLYDKEIEGKESRVYKNSLLSIKSDKRSMKA